VACRVLKVSRSGYYEWRSRPASDGDVADAHLLDTIIDIHTPLLEASTASAESTPSCVWADD
jgi:hypothetical protein